MKAEERSIDFAGLIVEMVDGAIVRLHEQLAREHMVMVPGSIRVAPDRDVAHEGEASVRFTCTAVTREQLDRYDPRERGQMLRELAPNEIDRLVELADSREKRAHRLQGELQRAQAELAEAREGLRSAEHRVDELHAYLVRVEAERDKLAGMVREMEAMHETLSNPRALHVQSMGDQVIAFEPHRVSQVVMDDERKAGRAVLGNPPRPRDVFQISDQPIGPKVDAADLQQRLGACSLPEALAAPANAWRRVLEVEGLLEQGLIDDRQARELLGIPAHGGATTKCITCGATFAGFASCPVCDREAKPIGMRDAEVDRLTQRMRMQPSPSTRAAFSVLYDEQLADEECASRGETSAMRCGHHHREGALYSISHLVALVGTVGFYGCHHCGHEIRAIDVAEAIKGSCIAKRRDSNDVDEDAVHDRALHLAEERAGTRTADARRALVERTRSRVERTAQTHAGWQLLGVQRAGKMRAYRDEIGQAIARDIAEAGRELAQAEAIEQASVEYEVYTGKLRTQSDRDGSLDQAEARIDELATRMREQCERAGHPRREGNARRPLYCLDCDEDLDCARKQPA